MKQPQAGSLLLIFVKNPEKGAVKTRLAESIGDANALSVYRQLLRLTKSVADQAGVQRQIWYSKFIDHDDLWTDLEYEKKLQTGNDLGSRMLHAFQQAFADHYNKVVIIGSDCADLESQILEDAFNRLDHNEVVLGPSEDGGYYLLGMSTLKPALFDLDEWSTSSVLEQTLKKTDSLGLSYSLLPVLNDIDTEKDLAKSPKDLGYS